MFGWQFKTTAQLEVQSVGLYHGFITLRGDGFFESHPVGIWDGSKPSCLMLQSLILAGNEATRDGLFLCVPTTPLALEANHLYVIGALHESSDLTKLDFKLNVLIEPILMEFGAGVEFERYRFGLTTQLRFPSFFIVGECKGIGPNFK